MGSPWFVGLVANLKFSSKCSSTLSLYCCVFASDKYIFATYHLFWSVPDQKSTIYYCPESILLFWFERVFSSSGCLISFMDGFSCSTSVEGVNYKVVVETFTFYYTYIYSLAKDQAYFYLRAHTLWALERENFSFQSTSFLLLKNCILPFST